MRHLQKLRETGVETCFYETKPVSQICVEHERRVDMMIGDIERGQLMVDREVAAAITKEAQ